MDKATHIRRKNLPVSVRDAIWRAHNMRCAYTTELLDFSEVEIDHIIPITIPKEELEVLIRDEIVVDGFDLNGLENFLPVKNIENRRKGNFVKGKSYLTHFLSVAKEKKAEIETLLAIHKSQSQVLNDYLNLKASADKFELSFDELIDICRQQTEGLTRIQNSIELLGCEEITLLNAQIANELMDKEFNFGGEIKEVSLTNENDEIVICKTCNEFIQAKKDKFWALSQYDMNCETWANQTCQMMNLIKSSKYAKNSKIRFPRISLSSLETLSSTWILNNINDMEGVEASLSIPASKLESSLTIVDLVNLGSCNVLDINPNRVNFVVRIDCKI